MTYQEEKKKLLDTEIKLLYEIDSKHTGEYEKCLDASDKAKSLLDFNDYSHSSLSQSLNFRIGLICEKLPTLSSTRREYSATKSVMKKVEGTWNKARIEHDEKLKELENRKSNKLARLSAIRKNTKTTTIIVLVAFAIIVLMADDSELSGADLFVTVIILMPILALIYTIISFVIVEILDKSIAGVHSHARAGFVNEAKKIVFPTKEKSEYEAAKRILVRVQNRLNDLEEEMESKVFLLDTALNRKA